MRVGIGYDAHRLVPGRPLILGGVEVPFEKGLMGHSDADVICHALADALLGAAGLGDLGKYFPDNDPQWKGISSLKLLEAVAARLKETGFHIANVDAVLVAERPRIGPYVSRMGQVLAHSLGISATQISVKATTTEGLGFVGMGEGMAAYAVAMIEEGRLKDS